MIFAIPMFEVTHIPQDFSKFYIPLLQLSSSALIQVVHRDLKSLNLLLTAPLRSNEDIPAVKVPLVNSGKLRLREWWIHRVENRVLLSGND